jgi:amino-acid N-acetyltransferase
MKTRPARAEDYELIRALLAANALPIEDITETAPIRFLIAEDSSARLGGCIGFETHGRDGLLRSLAVQPDLRAQGVGGSLVDAVLLTTTASAFFVRSGYEVVNRATAPELIRRSLQFASICPANAMCMTRAL